MHRRLRLARVLVRAFAGKRPEVGGKLACRLLELHGKDEREPGQVGFCPSPDGGDLAERPGDAGQIPQQELDPVMAGRRRVLGGCHRRSSPVVRP